MEVWWDHDLLGGDDYRARISKLLERTQAAIVIWSRRSVDSQWVMSEAAAARERQVLVPVTIDGARPPIDFRGLHMGGAQHIIPLVGLATLAMLLCSALAQRGMKRN